MAKKAAEKRVVAFAKYFDWYRHKYGDVRRCIHCHEILPKTENAPDYAIAPIYTWVEAKNSDSTETWKWHEIGPEGARKNQRDWLIRHGGWLFIELSNKGARGSEGRGAFLVPFKSWLNEVEPILIKANMKSIRLETKGKRPGADSLLQKWALEWVANVGWLPGPDHIFWVSLVSRLESELNIITTYQKERICPIL